MTVRDAMEAALRSEEKAHAFFVEALRHVREPQVRALLAELRDEEVDHQQMIHRELDRLAGQPPIDDEDFTDEPTSQ
jgi:rubrerythrin